jgi:hypothetical protein
MYFGEGGNGVLGMRQQFAPLRSEADCTLRFDRRAECQESAQAPESEQK